MIFFVENETGAKFSFDIEEVARAVAEEVLRNESIPFEVSIDMTVTDNEAIREINRENRGIDAPTDVLSFPSFSFEKPADFESIDLNMAGIVDKDTDTIWLGDIILNGTKVKTQAEEYGHSEKREFAFLTAHSILHLCGYDHENEEDARVMEEKQEKALNALSITRDTV